MKKLFISLTLTFFVCILYLFPAFAQPTSKGDKTTLSYIPSNPNPKDEENIDFLYKSLKGVLSASNTSSGSVPKEVLINRNSFSNFYYSPEEDAFALRELSKLARAMTCKASKVSRVRGIDLSSKLVGSFIESAKNNEPLQDTEPLDYDTGLILFKDAYEKFCPELW